MLELACKGDVKTNIGIFELSKIGELFLNYMQIKSLVCQDMGKIDFGLIHIDLTGSAKWEQLLSFFPEFISKTVNL